MLSSDQQNLSETLSGLDTKCPAFHHGCPFSNPQGRTAEDLVGKCPAFQSGCPFSGKTPEEVQELIKEIPHNHKLCPAFAYKASESSLACDQGSSLVDFVKSIRNDLFITPLESGSQPLSNEMLEGTLDVHAEAERCKFVKYLSKGKLEPEVYGRFLVCLYHVYSAMEEETRKLSSHPIVGLVHFPRQVNRIKPLVEDLEYFLGPNWKEKAVVSPATQEYVEDIRHKAKYAPHTLIAHPFTRYLGDMFGGQVLSKRIKRNFKLNNELGTAFYRFENITNVPDFREFYLDRLNAIRVTDQEKAEIIQASRRVFELNIGIFEEFGEDLSDDEGEDEPKKPKKAVSSSSKLAMKRRAGDSILVTPDSKEALNQPKTTASLTNIFAISVWVVLAIFYLYREGYLSFLASSQ